MPKYNIELLPAAYTDLDELFDYIMADNPTTADRMLNSIMDSLSRLENIRTPGRHCLRVHSKSSVLEW